MRYNLVHFRETKSTSSRTFARRPVAACVSCRLKYPTLSHGAHAARFTQWQSSTNVDLAFETTLIEIYRIVTRKTLWGPAATHLLNNEGVAHCKRSLSTMRTFVRNNEPRFRDIISPRGMSRNTSEKISTVRVSFDHPLTQTGLVHSPLGISQGDIISRNLATPSL